MFHEVVFGGGPLGVSIWIVLRQYGRVCVCIDPADAFAQKSLSPSPFF